MRLGRWVAAFAAWAALPAARAAEGDLDPQVEQAEAHFRSGYEAFHRKDYPVAVREFEAAQAIRPSPILDYNIGTAYEKIGKKELALQFLRRYLEESPDTPNKDQIEARIAALSKPPEPPKPPPEPPRPPDPAPLVCPAGQHLLGIHCCWPRQTWSDEDESCAGTPVCPAGFEAAGAGCRIERHPPPKKVEHEPEPPGPKPILFTARRGDRNAYHLKILGRDCDVPCTRSILTGNIDVEVQSPVSFTQSIFIPDRAATVTVQRRSMGALIAGSILLPLGTIGLIAGAGLIGGGSNSGITGAIVLVPISLGVLTTGVVLLAISGSNLLRVLPAGARASLRRVQFGLAAAPRSASAGLTVHF